ncbi:MAG: hypothetical protein ACJA0P_001960 [Planctomycetota bacterium]
MAGIHRTAGPATNSLGRNPWAEIDVLGHNDARPPPFLPNGHIMLLTSLFLLPLGGSTLPVSLPPPAKPGKGFHGPVALTTNGKPHEGILYPSPTVFDVDGDGVDELLIGEIFGSIKISEPLPGDDTLAWGKAQRMTTGGEPIKLNNW